MSKIRWHKDADPNDPRYVPGADRLPSLNEEPEAPADVREVVKVEVDNVTLNLNRDANDPRVDNFAVQP